MLYSFTNYEGIESISLIFREGMPVAVGEEHPKYRKIDELRTSGQLREMSEEDVMEILNEQKGTRWTSKITDGGAELTVYGLIDKQGNIVDTDLSKKLAQALGEDPDNEERIRAMVRFLIRAKENPSLPDSDKLYRWIFSEKLTLTPDGHFLGYKGVGTHNMARNGMNIVLPNGDSVPEEEVYSHTEDDVYWSYFSGGGITNGIEFTGNVPQWVGSVVEMPRDKVDSNGAVECSVGLHVGTYGYASNFVRHDGQLLLVKVDPRDVVSVPDYDFTKLRACRYTVVGEVDDILDTDLWVDEHYAPHIELDELEKSEYSGSESLDKMTEDVIDEIMKRIRELG